MAERDDAPGADGTVTGDAGPSAATEAPAAMEAAVEGQAATTIEATRAAAGRARRPIVRRLLRAVDLAATAVLGAAFVLVVFVGYGLVDNRWYHVVAVEGGSMAPTIVPGDLIVLARPPATVEPGMILTLEVDGAVVTHRVVRVLPDGRFITKGDANSVTDDFSRNDVRIVGQYVFRLPYVGKVITAASGPRSGGWLADRASARVRAGAAAAEAPMIASSDPSVPSEPVPDAASSPEPRPVLDVAASSGATVTAPST